MMNKDGLYVHIPFCASKCTYCNFVSGAYSADMKHAYITKVLEEATARQDEVGDVDSVYFGGGTPGQLSIIEFERLMSGLRRIFHISSDAEITFETNPETITEDYCHALIGAGVDRVSLGLQATQDSILTRLKRRHTYSDFLNAVERLRRVGIHNLSGDLMLGLPSQTEKEIAESLALITQLPLQHWSIYSLKVEEGTPLYESGYKTNDDAEASMYDMAVLALSGANFDRYETSNFARQGYACRHNLKYWKLVPYLGLGVSAHSDTRGQRSFNTSDLKQYMDGAIATYEHVSIQERKEEMVMLALRLEIGLERVAYRTRFGADFLDDYSVEKLLNLHCLDVTSTHIRIAKDKTYIANAILAELLA